MCKVSQFSGFQDHQYLEKESMCHFDRCHSYSSMLKVTVGGPK